MVSAILYGMRVSIDTAGRVVVPKPVRERLGLRPGVDIELKETAQGVLLSVAEPLPTLIRENGVWVYTGEVPAGLDSVQLVADDREERMRKIGGW